MWYKLHPHSDPTFSFLLLLTCTAQWCWVCFTWAWHGAHGKTPLPELPWAWGQPEPVSDIPALLQLLPAIHNIQASLSAQGWQLQTVGMVQPCSLHTCPSTPEPRSRCLQQNSNTAGATSWASKCSNLSSAVFFPFLSINSNNKKTSLSGLYNIDFGVFQFWWYTTLFSKPQVVISGTSMYVCEWNSAKQCLLKYPCTRDRMDKIDSNR